MSEQPVNPFDSDNFASGGGLWDGKTVTITSAKATIDRLTMGDGTPVLNDKGEPAIQNVLAITGLADEDDAERRQTYTAGALVPTADGDGFVKSDGTPGQFHKNSKAAKFFAAIKAGGFDLSRLFINGKPSLQGLVGARFTFQGIDRLDKDGNPKRNKKGYVVQDFFPVKFVGLATQTPVATLANNSAAKEEAVALVSALIAENGGTLLRKDMLRKVAAKVIGQPNGNAILSLVAKEGFSSADVPWIDVPWKWDGNTLSL
jgi:hypothetical protein